MGCGCMTPGSTVQMQNGQYIHSIKVTRIGKDNKITIGQRPVRNPKTLHNPFSKKQSSPSRPTINFDSKFGIHKNTHASIKKLTKKSTISIEDLQSTSKKKKNVKFKDQPRLSIKLEPIDKTDFQQKFPLKLFSKQNISPIKLIKKSKYIINKVKTQKQSFSPLIEDFQFAQAYQINLKQSQPKSQQIKNIFELKGNLPNIRRVQTEVNDPYLDSLKEIVLFGQSKKKIGASQQGIGKESNNSKKSFYFPDIDTMMDRLDFNRKKYKLF